MASGFKATNQALSRLLKEQARAVGVFDHPTGKGDGREELLRDFLRERTGTTFGVTKAEVVDSHDLSSHEIDAVIYDQSVASCLNVQGQRRVVRVESVAVVVEVRSILSRADAPEERTKLEAKFAKLTRVFTPTPFFQLILKNSGKALAGEEAMLAAGIGAFDSRAAIPRIVRAFFGYSGPSPSVAVDFADQAGADLVCVLGEYTLARPNLGFEAKPDAALVQWGTGDDALGAFLWQIEHVLRAFRDAAAFVAPAGDYFMPAGGAVMTALSNEQQQK